MKVLVVDDEAPARQRLRHLLENLDGVSVCGEAATGEAALTQYAQLAPDVVLMDIRMPGMDGMEAARHLAGLEAPPAVIFTTAYGDHALEAFEAQAVDYLLKPIRRERLAEALARASRLAPRQLAVVAEAGAPARSHLCAQLGGRLQLVPLGEVRYFRADQKYVSVRHSGGEVVIEASLKSLEEEFGARFMRVHRNALVALEHVLALEKDAEGRCLLRLSEIDESIEVSRRHQSAVRRALKGR